MRILSGDVGGTKTWLALTEVEPGRPPREVASERLPSGDYGGLTELVRAFLASHPGPVDRAGFGVAGPVQDGHSKTTNLPWAIDAARVGADLSIPHVRLINDFHAIALGIGALDPGDVRVLQDRPAHADGPVAILGAGTGLGEAVVVPTASGPRVLPSEGGHTDYGPRNDTEIALLRFMRARYDRVSVERVVSGPGLGVIYEFVVDEGLAETSDEIRRRVAEEDPGRVVGETALAGGDPACVKAAEIFVAAYGAEAGNLALKVLPTGGVFVAGGIAARILPLLEAGPFLAGFLDKGRMRPLLEGMRLSVVLNTRVGLLGARVAAEQP